MMESSILALGQSRPVIGFDTPGNGDSASPTGAPEMWDLAEIVANGLDTLGVEEFDIFGYHTGAMLGMELAIVRPHQVRHLIAEGLLMLSPEERRQRLASYLEPVLPAIEGTHLLWAWQHLRLTELWYPWTNRTPAARRENPFPDADALHAVVMDFLKGIFSYHQSYRSAQAYPTQERLPLIQTPSLHCAAPDDPLRKNLFPAAAMSPNAVAQETPGSRTPEAMAATFGLFRQFLDDARIDVPQYE
jgi:pimeloyl-ACP methyl ester carboxylesterase